jgi:hypothetical protein
MKTLMISNSQSNPKRKRNTEGIIVPYLKLYYRDTEVKTT